MTKKRGWKPAVIAELGPSLLKKYDVGDTVSFLRQCVGYENKYLIGVIKGFNYTENAMKERYAVAHVKADCEYGDKLTWNHTLLLSELTLIAKKNDNNKVPDNH